MPAYITRRFLEAVPVLFLVITVCFFLLRLAPGGPFSHEVEIPAATLERMEAHYGLDRPLFLQYTGYLGSLLKGDLGPSYHYPTRTVNEIIRDHLPVSLELGVWGLLAALLIGIGAGITSMIRPDSWLDSIPMGAAMIGICLPTFVLGPLLVLVFSLWLGWFNATGWNTAGDRVLPALTLGLFYAAYIARLTRGGMREVVRQDFIRTALAKGLPRSVVLAKHALRPGILPALAFLGPAAAGLLTGSFVVETVFHIPGLGREFVNAAFNRDYTLVLGVVVLFAVMILLFNLLVDIAQVLLNPRQRFE
jgi:oligopeptide transport system permease protein